MLNLISLRYGLVFILITIPFYVQIQWLLSWNDFSRYWYNIVIVLLLLIAFMRFSIDERFRCIRVNKLDKIFVISLLYGLLMVIYSYYKVGNWFSALNGFRLYYFGILLYFLTRFYIRKKDDIKPLVFTMLFIIFIASIELIMEVLIINSTKSFDFIPWVINAPEGLTSSKEGFLVSSFVRPYGIFFHHQHSAVFIAIGLLTTSFFYLKKYKIKELTFKRSFFYLFLLVLLLSSSRTAILSFFICLLIMIIKYKLLNVRNVTIALIAIILATSVYSYFYKIDYFKYLFINTLTLQDYYFGKTRFVNFNFSLTGLFLGTGFNIGAYELLNLEYSNPLIHSSPFLGIISEARFFMIFTQTGIIGGVLFLLYNILAYEMGIKTARNESDKYYSYLIIGLSFSILMVLFSTSHYLSFTTPGIQSYYYVIFGIISSLYEMGNRNLVRLRGIQVPT